MTARETLSLNSPVKMPSRSFFYDPFVRGVLFQLLLVAAVAAFGWWIIDNTIENLKAANIASGFDFLSDRAGYDISQKPIPYSIDDSHGRAFLVSLLNTLIVSVLGIIFATILGFVIGIARLSPNWLLGRIATVYVEVFRNIPLLLQLLFWYKAVLSVLPGPREAIPLLFGANLSNRGLTLPRPVAETGFNLVLYAGLLTLIFWYGLWRWAKARQAKTGRTFPVFLTGLALFTGVPLLVYLASGLPLHFEFPELKGFNFAGGMAVKPELMALLLGLSIYTAAFIAEVVRAGILSVARGQREAAEALGLRYGLRLRLVVIPQAMRVIIPPLTSQYLNLTKNSSLAVAIGYPDLVAVFAGSTLNITGRAVEAIFLTMGVYLSLSLLTALFMNYFNARFALVER